MGMTKSTIVLLVVLALLGAIYMFYFTDWFVKETIQIIPTIRPTRTIVRSRVDAPVYPVSFAFNGKYRLTRVAVVVAEDYRTNRFPTPLWELISDSESRPVSFIEYGGRVPQGLKPAIPRAKPQPLQPDVEYLLIIEAGKTKGLTNFHTREVITPASQ